jgi:hypothetical protein
VSVREDPCWACRIAPATPPCDRCPLRGAFADRGGDPETYAAWATSGGWRLVWTLGDLNRHRAARMRVLEILFVYPGMERRYPGYVAGHLEDR